jgi:hypothetical protein
VEDASRPYSLHRLNLVPFRLSLCSASASNAAAIRSAPAVTHPGVLHVVRLTSQESALLYSNSVSAAAVEGPRWRWLMVAC